MTPTHDNDTTAAGEARSTTGRHGLIAGAAVMLACAAACSLPLLLGGSAAATAAAFASGAEPIALGVLLLTALVTGGLWLRRLQTGATGTGCGCGQDCGCRPRLPAPRPADRPLTDREIP